MGGGLHHIREAPVMLQDRRVEKDQSDNEWIMAAAMLDTLADDLAATYAAGWWKDHPQEMAEVCNEARVLLKEFKSQSTELLLAIVRAATSGRVQISTGWLVRMARIKARKFATTTRKISYVAVQELLRKSISPPSNSKHKDMPPVRLPNGRFNPAYQRERARRMKLLEVKV